MIPPLTTEHSQHLEIEYLLGKAAADNQAGLPNGSGGMAGVIANDPQSPRGRGNSLSEFAFEMDDLDEGDRASGETVNNSV